MAVGTSTRTGACAPGADGTANASSANEGGATGHLRLFLATGVLGGYTTFSAYSLDAVLLWERHEHLLSALYVGGSVMASIAGLILGLWIMRTALA